MHILNRCVYKNSETENKLSHQNLFCQIKSILQSGHCWKLGSKSDPTDTIPDTSLGLLLEPLFSEKKKLHSLKMKLIFVNSQKASIVKPNT